MAITQQQAVILGGVLTLVGGIVGQLINVYIGNRLKRNNQRQKLREALYVELDSMAWLDEAEIVDISDMEKAEASHTFFPTMIFDASTENIGLLTKDELDPTLRYYNAAHIAQEQLELVREDGNKLSAKNFINHTLPTVKDNRKLASQEIYRNISGENHSVKSKVHNAFFTAVILSLVYSAILVFR